eukprot:5785086-Alexandrium_andersonii.AAC.1
MASGAARGPRYANEGASTRVRSRHPSGPQCFSNMSHVYVSRPGVSAPAHVDQRHRGPDQRP